MVSVCFYFQVHQPFRLRRFTIFDIGKNVPYFDLDKNYEILNKVSNKCYLETNKLLLELLKAIPEFKVSFSLSGVVLEQMKEHRPDVLKSFQELVKTGKVEVIQETYYHSLAYLFSEKEFIEQVKMHRKLVRELFGVSPTVFRNTELIYKNELAELISRLGYKGILLEGADHILTWRSPNFLYMPPGNVPVKLLLKNYRLSDDIAFRFSNRDWKEFPLTADKFASWVNQINGNGNTVNLFMDYETFGEHQWKDTGIFEFLKHLPGEILKHPDNKFNTPSELVEMYEPVGVLDVPEFISWADLERDTSAWTGNEMQRAALSYIYELQDAVLKTGDPKIISDWRKLQTSDHFYYMCTKWFSDGDVHKYFNPYDSPYEAFVNFNNILNDLILRIEKHHNKKLELPLLNEVRLDLKWGD